MLAIRQKHNILRVAFMMLITGALGLWREHQNTSYFCSAVHKKRKRKTKKEAATGQWCFCLCFCVHFCSATGFWNHELSILSCGGNLKPTPAPSRIHCSIVGSCCHLRPSPAQHAFGLHQTLELIPHSQQGLETEWYLPRQGGCLCVSVCVCVCVCVCRGEWMDVSGRTVSRYSPH